MFSTVDKPALPGSVSWRELAQAAWLLITILLWTLFVVSLPLTYHRMVVEPAGSVVGSNISVADLRTGLAQLGLSPRFYAGYLLGLALLFALVYSGMGALIFWRRAHDRMALLIAFWLAIFGLTFPPLISDLLDQRMQAGWLWATLVLFVTSISVMGFASFFLVFLLFPDGRFAPRWTRWLALILIGRILLGNLYADSYLVPMLGHPLLNLLFAVGCMGALFYAQIYRYRYVSTPVQRRQTRWVVFGLATALTGLVVTGIVNALLPTFKLSSAEALLCDLAMGTTLIFTFLAIPLTMGIAILRYRLYDIDILIRRTVVYTAFTVTLALVYFGCVALLQQLLRSITGQGQNQLVTVASTLAIAALFAPLRRRIQNSIDQRFYRRAYNAEQVLTAFGETVRNETDLDKISERLTIVVQETMQPTRITLWLRKSEVVYYQRSIDGGVDGR